MALFDAERQHYERQYAKLQADTDMRLSVLREENMQLRRLLESAERWIASHPTPLRNSGSYLVVKKKRERRMQSEVRRTQLAQIAAAAIRAYLWYFVQGINPLHHPYALTKLFNTVEKELGKEFKQTQERKDEHLQALQYLQGNSNEKAS